MNYKAYQLIQAYVDREPDEKFDAPQEMPTEFWEDTLYYAKMLGTGYKLVNSLVGPVPENFSHLQYHGIEELGEIADKWPAECFFWWFQEFGYHEPEPERDEDLNPVAGHEYLAQQSDNPRWGEFELIDLTENKVVWQAPTYEECQQWIDREICEYCCNWANDTVPTKDGQVCPSCRGEVSGV